MGLYERILLELDCLGRLAKYLDSYTTVNLCNFFLFFFKSHFESLKC